MVVTTHLRFQDLAWEPLHPSYLSRRMGNFLRTATHDAVLRRRDPSELAPIIGSLQDAMPRTIFAQRGPVYYVVVLNKTFIYCAEKIFLFTITCFLEDYQPSGSDFRADNLAEGQV